MADREGGGNGREELLWLPHDRRKEFKHPMGPVFTDVEELRSVAGSPLVAVGDVVSYHLREAGTVPDVSLVDGRTEREAAPAEVRERVVPGDVPRVHNPPATLTSDLLGAIRTALDAPDSVTIVVDGEEDLAAIPAVLAVPHGGSVVYGQPGEGMVHVRADEESVARAEELFSLLEGDHDRARRLLGIDGSSGDGPGS